MMISQYDPAYLESHMRYNKALLQRNSVLRANGQDAGSMLEIYDEQMA
ncbi:MAG: DNA replication and repair protein RecF, partial [Bacteroidales bacterium]|nr:DNA replication and repair protein RecF [Bacteroidales bacterium]